MEFSTFFGRTDAMLRYSRYLPPQLKLQGGLKCLQGRCKKRMSRNSSDSPGMPLLTVPKLTRFHSNSKFGIRPTELYMDRYEFKSLESIRCPASRRP